MKLSHYRRAVGALLVYDVTKNSTFLNAQKWLCEIRNNTEPQCIIMLVGNKIDLVERNSRKREVTIEEGRRFAADNQLIFSETSALSNHKVTESFEDLLQGNLSLSIISEIYNEKRKVSRLPKKSQIGSVILGQGGRKTEDKGCC